MTEQTTPQSGVKTPAKKNWFERHKVWTTIGVIVIMLAIIGIAGSGDNNTQLVTTPSTPSATPAKTQPKPQTAKVGDTLTIGGDQGVAVTLAQVIDPASSDNPYETPDAGTRFVATKLVIVNKGTASYQDDANGNVTVIGTDNQSYTFDPIADTSGCTNFSSGQYTLAPGASATGCVTFQLPNGISAAKVQFTTNDGLVGNTGEWVVQ